MALAPFRSADTRTTKAEKYLELTKDGMVDFIFGVTHATHWHSLNIRQNPTHYSCASNLGAGTVASLQQNYGAKVYYNTDVNVAGMRIKYGVVTIDHLLSDLNNWDTMYLAGRMQKPVLNFYSDHYTSQGCTREISAAAKLSECIAVSFADFTRKIYSRRAIFNNRRSFVHWRFPNALWRKSSQSVQYCIFTTSIAATSIL